MEQVNCNNVETSKQQQYNQLVDIEMEITGGKYMLLVTCYLFEVF